MPGGSAPECAPLPRPSYLAICVHKAVVRWVKWQAPRERHFRTSYRVSDHTHGAWVWAGTSTRKRTRPIGQSTDFSFEVHCVGSVSIRIVRFPSHIDDASLISRRSRVILLQEIRIRALLPRYGRYSRLM